MGDDPARTALTRFYQEVGEKYPEESVVYRTLRGRLRKAYVLSVLQTFSGRLLDVGCNGGMYLMHYTGGERFGVDISVPVLRRIPRDADLRLVAADAENLYCFRGDSFDHVLCSEVLEHCLQPHAVFAAIRHVLRPGGTALVTTPNYSRKRPEWIGLGTLEHYGVDCDCPQGYFHTAYRPDELRRLAEESGLIVLETGTLEKQIKYAAKLPAALLLLGRFMNRFLRSERWERANEAAFQHSSWIIYRFMQVTRLEKLVLPLIREGVRSRILVQKPRAEFGSKKPNVEAPSACLRPQQEQGKSR
ncbi:class I SAM-dependent methyltransferase [candidate division KSB1 bacterium]|nr:class I SAM-dependent methyltransferase [candidate division KSB1 bacterium]